MAVNKLLSNLPRTIVFWQVCLLFFIDTNFYYNNQILINKMDTPFLFISLLHLIFYSEFYSIKKLIFVVGILFLFQLQLLSYILTDILYYSLYILILISTIATSFFINEHGRN